MKDASVPKEQDKKARLAWLFSVGVVGDASIFIYIFASEEEKTTIVRKESNLHKI